MDSVDLQERFAESIFPPENAQLPPMADSTPTHILGARPYFGERDRVNEVTNVWGSHLGTWKIRYQDSGRWAKAEQK